MLSDLCETAKKSVVLMIDEVDRASDNQIFLDFLGRLRYAYLNKKKKQGITELVIDGKKIVEVVV